MWRRVAGYAVPDDWKDRIPSLSGSSSHRFYDLQHKFLIILLQTIFGSRYVMFTNEIRFRLFLFLPAANGMTAHFPLVLVTSSLVFPPKLQNIVTWCDCDLPYLFSITNSSKLPIFLTHLCKFTLSAFSELQFISAIKYPNFFLTKNGESNLSNSDCSWLITATGLSSYNLRLKL